MQKRLALFFAAILMLSALLAAFHHHEDGASHDDCSFCVAQQHTSATVNSSSGIQPSTMEIANSLDVFSPFPEAVPLFEATRAPPA